MIPWLVAQHTPAFPALHTALADPNGLLAAGGRLSPAWLLSAYQSGIFPWYSEGEPILWWSPDPRMVLFPAELRVSRSLAKTLRKRQYTVRCDTAFAAVIAACAAPRGGASGTWITPAMQHAYLRMHELGWAHSVETWVEDELVGGLYGMAIGKVFYGESMFARRTDASKIAVAHLARDLERRGFQVIDCQMKTAHLASLGAREITRAEFAETLQRHADATAQPAHWTSDRMQDLDWTGNPT